MMNSTRGTVISIFVLGLALPAVGEDNAPPAAAAAKEVDSVLDLEVRTIDGETVKLDKYRGEVCLIVNVASKCGLTDRNYRELEPLYRKYRERGFRVLAFPANNFMGQEPGSNTEIKKFCASKYDVTFDLFDKVSVKGDDICPLYEYLTKHPDEDIAGDVKWNFQKYLVNRNGDVIAKFGPRVNPNDKKIVAQLEQALAAPKADADAADKKDT